MTLEEFRLHFEQFRIEAYNYIRHSSPYRTGKLRESIKFQQNADGFSIIIDIYYMQYTEEVWTYNSRWGKTLTNPNLYWLKKSVERLAQRFANRIKGVVISVN